VIVWLTVLELLIAIDPRPPSWALYVHIGLGVLIVLVAAWNYLRLRETEAPGRIKRTVRATFGISVAMAFLGVLLWANVGAGWNLVLGYSVWDVIHIFHVLNGLAILAQAAAAATAFDMWEEKEFEHPTRPGEIPEPAPMTT
jgi:hypothetical protein